MRVLVCGHREFDDWALLDQELTKLYRQGLWGIKDDKFDFTIIEGEAKGADFLARVWAKFRNLPCERFPADWDTYGKKAGPIRNAQMLKEGKPDVVLAFLAKGSVGTADMIRQSKAYGIKPIVVNID